MKSAIALTLGVMGTALMTGASQGAATGERVEVVKVPGASRIMKAEAGSNGTIHLVYDAADGPQYVHSEDGGRTFSAPLPVVDRASRKPGLEYSTWDMAVGGDGRVHVALGTNAWKLKLPQEVWGLYYASLAPGEKAFAPLRNLNHKPSEGFSLAAGDGGAVTASFLSGKVYTVSSHDGGANFTESHELDPALDPCKCCTTSLAYGPAGQVALLYRDETNNDRDIYMASWNPAGGDTAKVTRTRVSGTSWKVMACPMTYFSLRGTPTGYVAAWPTKGHIYFARLNKDGAVLPPGEILTPGTNGMRTGVLALNAPDGQTLVGWKSQDTLGWQLYDANGRPVGAAGSTPSAGAGAAGVVLPSGKFLLFP